MVSDDVMWGWYDSWLCTVAQYYEGTWECSDVIRVKG